MNLNPDSPRGAEGASGGSVPGADRGPRAGSPRGVVECDRVSCNKVDLMLALPGRYRSLS